MQFAAFTKLAFLTVSFQMPPNQETCYGNR